MTSEILNGAGYFIIFVVAGYIIITVVADDPEAIDKFMDRAIPITLICAMWFVILMVPIALLTGVECD